MLLVDGRIAGVWRHERRAGAVEVDIEPFEKPSAGLRRRAEAEAARIAGFLGGDPAVRWA